MYNGREGVTGNLRVLVVGLRVRGGGWQEASERPLQQQLPERLPELAGHRAVQDKVDSTVHQRQHVHDLSK